MSRADMVHYLDVRGWWDAGECEWCFDRAVAYRAEHALGILGPSHAARVDAEPRVDVLMDLGKIRSSLPAILGSACAAGNPAAPSVPAGSPATCDASPAWSFCWRCSSCWAAYRRAVSFATFLVLVARSPRVATLWKARIDTASATLAALVSELGVCRQEEQDCFASTLVQVLGVKESADLQEGFGFFMQHLLRDSVEKVQAEGKREKGKRAFALGNAGPIATVAMKLMGGGRGVESIGGGRTVGLGGILPAPGVREDGGDGNGGSQGRDGGAGNGARTFRDVGWREHLKGREWERYVDGMAWILEHGGGEGRGLSVLQARVP
ncbi:unnamed protein product [Closterium sp. NIES-65]|nr:unnamed protein product [Closterium sp. NIES-65]CAI6007164.1 unnamed protein product [Closterium sp. NIES-65]CAI6010759.1 unnamed protein product [Closterium sp. NIES-65]